MKRRRSRNARYTSKERWEKLYSAARRVQKTGREEMVYIPDVRESFHLISGPRGTLGVRRLRSPGAPEGRWMYYRDLSTLGKQMNPRRYRRNPKPSMEARQARKRVAIKRMLRRAGHRIPAGIMFSTGALRSYRRRKLGYNKSRKYGTRRRRSRR